MPLNPFINAISGRKARLKKIKAKNEFQFTIEKAI